MLPNQTEAQKQHFGTCKAKFAELDFTRDLIKGVSSPSVKKGNCGKGWQKYTMPFTAWFLLRRMFLHVDVTPNLRGTEGCAGTQ